MTAADYRSELDAFIAELNRAWRAAGGPSFAQLASLAEQLHNQQRPGGVRFVSLPRSTTSEILGGRRKHALKWPWVLTFLSALQEAARQGGINAAEVGSIEEWKRKYEAVLAAHHAQPRPAQADGPRQHGMLSGVGVIDRALAGETSIVAALENDSDADAQLELFLMMVLRSMPKGRHSGRDIAPEWLEQYVALESLAGDVIRAYQTAVVPALLQTEAYARAVTAQRLPDATPDEIARLVRRVAQRQSLRGQQRPCRLWAVIEEAAFRNRQVDTGIMRAQIEHLIILADQADVALQIMPTSIPSNLTRSEPMTVFRFPEPFLGDVVFLDQPDHAPFLFKRKDTDLYKQLFVSLSRVASRPSDAKQVLTTILGEI